MIHNSSENMIFDLMVYKKYNEKEFKKAVADSYSIANVCRLLNLAPKGGNYKTIRHWIKEWNIDSSHFTGQAWNVGQIHQPNPPRPLEEILVRDSDYRSSTALKGRVLRAELLKYECSIEECNISDEWLGQKIVLELDHINGINNDHRIENLRLLCPNCHSQTKTFRNNKR